jgi:hypothetical protein
MIVVNNICFKMDSEYGIANSFAENCVKLPKIAQNRRNIRKIAENSRICDPEDRPHKGMTTPAIGFVALSPPQLCIYPFI